MELSILEGGRPGTTRDVLGSGPGTGSGTGTAAGPGGRAEVTVHEADAAERAAYRAIRRDVFVAEQGLFDHDDHDAVDDDPRTVVLVARDADGVVGGVRLAPAGVGAGPAPDLGWWAGSRLVVRREARRSAAVGPTLVRAACAAAEARGVLRFDAAVQERNAVLFRRLGWVETGRAELHGHPHVLVRWPVDRLRRQAEAAKLALGPLLAGLTGAAPGGAGVGGAGLGGAGFVGDDGAPVPGSDLVAACDAIVPSMVERHPEWAGWCAVLVNVNDLTAMGATPVGLLDAVAGRDRSFVARVLNGLRDGAQAWGVPVLGGHTQLGVPAALSVTALGRAARPVPAGGAVPGHALSLTADLTGGWRQGFAGQQWDSTSGRRGDELRALAASVGRAGPAAAKDVSMAGLVGTAGMLAEASGVGLSVEVGAVPRPAGVTVADWLSCFPGFAMLTADAPGASRMGSSHGVAGVASAEIGTVTAGSGVRLRWPDGVETEATGPAVTSLGRA